MQKVKRFFGLVSSDLMKLSRMKSVYIGIAVMFFLTLVIALAQGAFSSLLQGLPSESGEAIPPAAAEEIGMTFVFMLLNAAPSSTGVYFLIPIIAALFIGSDFSSGMSRLYVGRGVHKTELYLSKFIVVTLLFVVYTCIAFAMAAVAAKVSGLSAGTLDTIFSYTPDAFGAYLLLAVVMSAITTSVCFLVRSKAGAMAMLLAMLIVLGDILVTVVQMALAMSVTGTDVTGNFVYMHFDPYYCTDAFAYARDFTQKTAGIAYGGSVMWAVFFLFGGMFLNAKRDIK